MPSKNSSKKTSSGSKSSQGRSKGTTSSGSSKTRSASTTQKKTSKTTNPKSSTTPGASSSGLKVHFENKKEFYDKFYAENVWKELKQCRIHIPGENLWGRLLPNGERILDNEPLDERWRYQDVVDGNLNIIHRRWNSKIWFEYEALEDEDKDIKRRGELFEAAKSVGNVNFFFRGIAYVLSEEKDYHTAVQAVKNALKDIPFVRSVARISDEEDKAPEARPN